MGIALQAPGQLIKIGDGEIHYITKGKKDSPTVIFEHGCGQGSSALIWTLVMNEAANFSHTISYDRAGYGWSTGGSFPRTNEKCVEDLYNFLKEIEAKPPYILVGHSYGGINMRLFAQAYPSLVGGLVLVDPMHEDEQTERFPAVYRKGQKWALRFFYILKGLSKMGLLNLLSSSKDVKKLLAYFPEQVQPLVKQTIMRKDTSNYVYSEFKNVNFGFNRLRTVNSLGDTPVIVLQSTKIENVPGATPEELTTIKETFKNIANELSASSSNGKCMIVENAGHNLHCEFPQTIVEAIESLAKGNIHK